MPIDYAFFYSIITGIKHTIDFQRDSKNLLGSGGKLQKILDHRIMTESDMLSILCKDDDGLIEHFITTLDFGRKQSDVESENIRTIGELYDRLDNNFNMG